MEAPTIIEKNGDSVSERVYSFMIKLPDTLLRVEKQKDGRVASQPADFLTDESFEKSTLSSASEALQIGRIPTLVVQGKS